VYAKGVRQMKTDGPIVLVVAPDKSLPLKGFGTKDFLGRMPNIGVLYLAGALEKQGYKTAILDKQHSETSPLKLASEINGLRPSLVGFTLYDITAESTCRTLSLLRLAYHGPIVIGGYTPTFHAEDILRGWSEVDFVVLREGEEAIVKLMQYLEGRRPIEDVPNLVYRSNNKICFNREGSLVDVRLLPWPRRLWPESGDVTPIVTRRGCLSRCSFCSMVPFYDPSLGSLVRWREPGDVAEEIGFCIDHGSREFMFYDDDFGLSAKVERDWCFSFIEEVEKRDLRFHWGIELRVPDVVRGASLLRKLCDIGLTHISIGMESMLPRQLKLYNKGYKQADVFEAIEIAKDLPLDFQTNVIFWDPWLTLAEAIEHINLLAQIGIQDQLGSANFPFFSGVLVARRQTKVHTMLSEANRLRLRPGSFCEYEYDFFDPSVAAYHRGPHMDFLLRVRSTPRPPALWLFVPRLEHGGNRELASAYRTYAAAVAHAEFDYFKALLTTVSSIQDPAEADHAAAKIHDVFGARVDACSLLLPDVSPLPSAV
jgi:anaerobic magnesium-protoporphyrin IX monomethyl ester cyclase